MRPPRPAHVAVALAAAALLALPFLVAQGLLNAAIQMMIAALFACAYNLLCGQAGMLSFGHAAYFGIGAFATVHAMSALGGKGLLPTPLLPLIGAVAGLGVGAITGWFATKRAGTYFAMITLAIAELLHSLAPQLQGLFGGEGGLSSMRSPAWGLTFGSTTEVYFLTLAWVGGSLALLFLLTRTPLGRLTLGLRENGHRLRFLGYNVHGLSVLAFSVSAMFSGIAGALQAIGNEAANYVLFEAGVSASVVLNTYVGGVGTFLGPALGAALMTIFGYAVSDLTVSWHLYQGALFVFVMMFQPTGLAGVLGRLSTLRTREGLVRTLPALLLALLAAALLVSGVFLLVELVQRFLSQDYRALASAAASAGGAPASVAFLGRAWSPSHALTWVLAPALLACGAWAARFARRAFASRAREQGEARDAAARRNPLAGSA